MDCPECGSDETNEGWLELKKSIMGFALFGFGAYHLYFEVENGQNKRVLRARRRMRAHECRSCGTLIARPEHR
ncbi:MAG: hypothetical protein KY455_13805 [Euryarchaeota archaeon]|nr:hypothetical protein [Euryarchaeota archaeon]